MKRKSERANLFEERGVEEALFPRVHVDRPSTLSQRQAHAHAPPLNLRCRCRQARFEEEGRLGHGIAVLLRRLMVPASEERGLSTREDAVVIIACSEEITTPRYAIAFHRNV